MSILRRVIEIADDGKDRPRVLSCAPKHPPCFADREQWVEYLCAVRADEKKRSLPASAAFRVVGGRLAFNLGFNFCDDCTSEFRRKMRDAGRCDPTVILRQAPPELGGAALNRRRRVALHDAAGA